MRLIGKMTLLPVVGSIRIAAAKQTAVRWSDIPEGVVIGLLEKPLGTVCKIRGTAVKPAQENKGDGDNLIVLNVDAIDDVVLGKPISFRVPDGISDLKVQPTSGNSFTYVAYETGCFVGPMNDPNKLAPQLQEPISQNNFGGKYNLLLELHVLPSNAK